MIPILIYSALIVGVACGIWYGSRMLLRFYMKRELIRIFDLMVKKIDTKVAGIDDMNDLFSSMVAIIIGRDPEQYTKELRREFERFKKHMGDHYRPEPPQPTPRKWG